ncbi:M23 family metallopeptidase [Crenalkalicoccus roseus]|uniref:M23 family metallopeptidase n=1 Tax=Crenalkalicoccus roseus TaxID=1485588 RepID=UPI001080B313|nr:M23 family metallopeptidase [Crenalkalicoccus roseus]
MALRPTRGARWLPLACLLAFPIAAVAHQEERLPLTQTLAALPADPLAEDPEPPIRVLTVRRGDSLTRILASSGIGAAEAAPLLAALTELFPPRGLQPGHALTLHFDPGEQDRLLGLDLEPEAGRTIRVRRDGTAWQAEEVLVEQHRHLVLARGEVRGALITSLVRAGLPAPLAAGLVRMLAHELDFERDLHPGDRFTVLFERFRDEEGALLRHGEIVHAELLLSDRRLSLWRHETAEGADWFDDQGRSFRRAFLRTPLDGARLTSGFGMRRHPVLGFSRMHHGVDFAAPAGTPVYAAADGVVVEAGWRGGYGRIIRLRHAGGTHTLYAHLSGFAPGLRPGKQVRQGEMIGRVGSTGTSTGPHLHYEVHLAGRPVDPATAPAQAVVQLAGAELAAFQAARRTLLTHLARLAPMEEVAWAD